MRLFIGLQLPPSVLSLATNVQKCVLNSSNNNSIRPVPLATHGHVTLVFLGETDASVPSVLRLAVRSAIDSLQLRLPPQLRVSHRVATFGDNANVLYAPVTVDESTNALQKAVRSAATSVHPETARDRNKFRAHITLARAKGGKRTSKQRRNAVNMANQQLVGNNSDVTFTADNVVLFESTRNESDGGKLIYKELWKESVCLTQLHGQSGSGISIQQESVEIDDREISS